MNSIIQLLFTIVPQLVIEWQGEEVWLSRLMNNNSKMHFESQSRFSPIEERAFAGPTGLHHPVPIKGIRVSTSTLGVDNR